MERLLFVGPVEKYFVREMLRGLAMDARFRQAWTILTQAPPGSAAAWQALLQQVQPDAIVAHARLDPDEYRLLQRLGRPLVLLETAQPARALRLAVDGEAIGRLAADYFLEHHFHEFAYAGYAGLPVFEQRGAAFRHRLEQAGFPVRTLRIDPVQDTLLPYSGPRTLRLATELRGLPAAPCAVFCGNDAIAALLLELCQREDIRVPHELAVLGVNNDSLLCRLCYPPLSSIRLPYRELGRLAAERLLNWQPDFAREGHVLVLPPNEVVERQSTSLQRISDPVVLRAVDYMVAHLGEAFPMQQLRQCTGVSTPTLMKRFRTHLQMTPIAQLRQLRIQQAKRLLLHPRKELRQVARACGFRRTEHFLATFKQLTGLTVTSYCKQHGPAPAP
jgi:LacI family transcriptional regulator